MRRLCEVKGTPSVAVLELPVVVGFEETTRMSRTIESSLGKIADDIGPPLDLTIEAFQGVSGVQLGPVLAWEGHVGEQA
jgi:hypothetical protein